METQEREMTRLIFDITEDATSVDLSRFELITVVSDEAWQQLRLQKMLIMLKLPPALRRIEETAFYTSMCKKLEYVNFASLTSLQGIGERAFCCCFRLPGVLELSGSSLQVIEYSAFTNCWRLTALHLPSSLLRIEDCAFDGCEGFRGQLDLPELEHLGVQAFTNCRGFTGALKIPLSLKSVARESFGRCAGFTSLDLHSSLESIRESAFANCTGFAGPLVLPDSVHFIGEYAFASTAFTGVLRLPSSLLYVQGGSFQGCEGFSSVEFPSTLLEIATGAFNGCTGLKGELELPESLQFLGDRAFEGCTGLTETIKLPPFLAFIDGNAFDGCTGLTGVQEAIQLHRRRFNQWKARCILLMIISRMDSAYRREVTENNGLLYSPSSNAFLARFPLDGQIIYKAIAFVDGEGKLGNGIRRKTLMKRK
jgi:hypothetical protein